MQVILPIFITHIAFYDVTIFHYMSNKITSPTSNGIFISKSVSIHGLLISCRRFKFFVKHSLLVGTKFFFATHHITNLYKYNTILIFWILFSSQDFIQDSRAIVLSVCVNPYSSFPLNCTKCFIFQV